MRLLGTAILLVFGACARPQPAVAQTSSPTENVPVFIDARFSLSDKAVIRDALSEWNEALGGYMRFYVESESFERPSHDPLVDVSRLWTDRIGVTIDWEPPDCQHCKWQLLDIAWVSKVGAHDVHVVTSRIELYDRRSVIEHEFGHVLGLDHTDEPDQLMTHYIEHQAHCIDAATVGRVAAVHRWDATHMRTTCR